MWRRRKPVFSQTTSRGHSVSIEVCVTDSSYCPMAAGVGGCSETLNSQSGSTPTPVEDNLGLLILTVLFSLGLRLFRFCIPETAQFIYSVFSIHFHVFYWFPPEVKQVLPEVVAMLPNDDTGADPPTEVTACLCHILINLCQSNPQHVRAIVSQGALPKVINISSKDSGLVSALSSHSTNEGQYKK